MPPTGQRIRLVAALMAMTAAFQHLYGAQAYPQSGIGAAGIFLILALWAAALGGAAAATPRLVAALAIGMLWTLVAAFGVYRSEVPAAGRDLAANYYAGWLQFAAAALLCAAGRARTAMPLQIPIANPRAKTDSQKPEPRAWDDPAFVLLAAMTAAAVVMAAYAICQKFILYPQSLEILRASPWVYGADSEMRDGIDYALAEGRVRGTFGDPNVLAGFLSLGAALVLGLAGAKRWTRTRERLGMVACLSLLGMALALTRSRGGLIVFAAALAGGGWIYRSAMTSPGNRSLLTRRGLKIGVAAAVAAVLAFAAIWQTPLADNWKRRLTATSTIKARADYWQVASRMWREQPLLGHGTGAFALKFARYSELESNEASDPHSWLMRAAAEQGAVGLAIFLGWLAVCCIPAMRKSPASDNPDAGRVLRRCAIAGAGVLLLSGLVQLNFTFREVYLELCLMLGIAVGSCPLAAGTATHRPWVSPRIAIGAVASLLAIAAAGFWPFLAKSDYTRWMQWNGRDAQTNAADARQRHEPAEARQWVLAALNAFRSGLRRSPDNPWLMDDIAQLYLSPELSDPERSLEWSKRAAETHATSSAMRANLARTLHLLRRDDEAIREWQAAIDLHPASPAPYAGRAATLADLKQWDLALKDAHTAATIATERHRSADRYTAFEARIAADALKAGHGAP